MKNNVCLLISSPSSYRDVFEISSKLLSKNWPSCPYRKVYSTDDFNKEEYNGFDVILFPKRENWIGRMTDTLEYISEDYIILLTDDLFLNKRIEENYFGKLLDYIMCNDVKYCRLYKNNSFRKRDKKLDDDIYQLHYNQSYAISLLGAIWEKKYLLEFLQKSDSSAWELENSIQKQFLLKGNQQIIGHVYFHNNIFYHAVYKGKWMIGAKKIIKINDLILHSYRKKVSIIKSIEIFVKKSVRDFLSPKTRYKLKLFLSKIIKFDTKY